MYLKAQRDRIGAQRFRELSASARQHRAEVGYLPLPAQEQYIREQDTKFAAQMAKLFPPASPTRTYTKLLNSSGAPSPNMPLVASKSGTQVFGQSGSSLVHSSLDLKSRLTEERSHAIALQHEISRLNKEVSQY